jgi:hypothetical protein
MAAISFSTSDAWVKARWAVTRLLNDVASLAPSDLGVQTTIRQAVALDGVHFPLLPQPISDRLLDLLREAVQGTLNSEDLPDARWKDGLDSQSRAQYLQAVRELAAMLERIPDQRDARTPERV